MTDTNLSILQQPSPQAIAARDRSKPGKVTGKIKRAIEEMVWVGSRRDDAALAAGLTVHGLREALKRPHVKAYYLQQLEVLRTSERARNIHRLIAIRDAADNMPAVQAIDRLERLDEQRSAAAQHAAPGFVVQVIVQQPSHTAHMQSNEAKPLIEHELGRQPDDEHGK